MCKDTRLYLLVTQLKIMNINIAQFIACWMRKTCQLYFTRPVAFFCVFQLLRRKGKSESSKNIRAAWAIYQQVAVRCQCFPALIINVVQLVKPAADQKDW